MLYWCHLNVFFPLLFDLHIKPDVFTAVWYHLSTKYVAMPELNVFFVLKYSSVGNTISRICLFSIFSFSAYVTHSIFNPSSIFLGNIHENLINCCAVNVLLFHEKTTLNSSSKIKDAKGIPKVRCRSSRNNLQRFHWNYGIYWGGLVKNIWLV